MPFLVHTVNKGEWIFYRTSTIINHAQDEGVERGQNDASSLVVAGDNRAAAFASPSAVTRLSI